MHEDLERAAAQLDPTTLGRRLKQARIAAGLTQPDLGGPHASAAYLSRIERGQRRPSPALLDRLCERLGVSVELIVLGAAEPDPREIECEVGFAELALATGSTAEALERAERLAAGSLGELPVDLLLRVSMVRGGAQAAHGETGAAIATFEDVLAAGPAPTIRATASLRLARLLRETGDVARSIAVGEHTLEQLEGRAGAPIDDLVRLSVTVAAGYWESGDVDRARELCRTAISASEASGSPAARGAAYWNTAIIESEAGNLDEALVLTRRALTLFETESDLRLYARLRTQLAELLVRADPPETDEALRHLTDAGQALGLTAADAVERLHHRMAFARAYFAAGDLEAAEHEALACAGDPGVQPFVAATATVLLGRVALERDDVAGARVYFLEAVAALTGAGADRRVAQLWFSLAGALDQSGLSDQAKDAYRRAAASTGLVSTFGSVRAMTS